MVVVGVIKVVEKKDFIGVRIMKVVVEKKKNLCGSFIKELL